jgi:hypothetical protein
VHGFDVVPQVPATMSRKSVKMAAEWPCGWGGLGAVAAQP